VGLALLIDPGRPVAHGQVGPVVVLFALSASQLLPPLLRLLPLWQQERPQGGGVDHDSVVEVRRVAGIYLSRRARAVGRRRSFLCALLHGGDEAVEFLSPPLDLRVAPLRVPGRAAVTALSGFPQIVEFSVETSDRRLQAVRKEDAQRVLGPAV